MLRYCKGLSRSNGAGVGDGCGRCASTATVESNSAATRRRMAIWRDAQNVLNIRMGSFALLLEKVDWLAASNNSNSSVRIGIVKAICRWLISYVLHAADGSLIL